MSTATPSPVEIRTCTCGLQMLRSTGTQRYFFCANCDVTQPQESGDKSIRDGAGLPRKTTSRDRIFTGEWRRRFPKIYPSQGLGADATRPGMTASIVRHGTRAALAKREREYPARFFGRGACGRSRHIPTRGPGNSGSAKPNDRRRQYDSQE